MSSLPRRTVLLSLALAGCATHLVPPGPAIQRPRATAQAFVMPDGMRLPYRAWLPAGRPWAVMLALHGMDDSRDAWEIPAPVFADAGIAVFAPDQRGFGATAARGYWPGTAALVDDARHMAALVRARYPHAQLVLIGESMGAAVLMCLAAARASPPDESYVLVAPAVWDRDEMNLFERAALWLLAGLLPGLTTTGRAAHVLASDNLQALIRLSRDPLTIHNTRFDAIRGMVNLMDAAVAAAPRLHAPALVMYGGKDELIPPRAMAHLWRALPSGVVRAFYPHGYHLLLRDLDRVVPTVDILSWLLDPAAPLPSGAEAAAAAWLARQPDGTRMATGSRPSTAHRPG